MSDFEFPETVGQAFEIRKGLKAQIDRLEAQYKALGTFIERQVPANQKDEKGNLFGIKDGIRVLRWRQPVVSWRKACDAIVEQLVPKTRRAEADELIDKNTSMFERYGIFAEEDESEG